LDFITTFVPTALELFVFVPSDPSGQNRTGAFVYSYSTSTWAAYGSPNGVPLSDFEGAGVSVMGDKVLLFGVGSGAQTNIYCLENGSWSIVVSPQPFIGGGGIATADAITTHNTQLYYLDSTMINMTRWTFQPGVSGVKADSLVSPPNPTLYSNKGGSGAIMSPAGNGFLFLYNSAAQSPLSIYDTSQGNWSSPSNQLLLGNSPSQSSLPPYAGPVIGGVFGSVAVALGVVAFVLIRKRRKLNSHGHRLRDDEEDVLTAGFDSRDAPETTMANISHEPKSDVPQYIAPKVGISSAIRSNSRRLAKGVSAFLFGDTGPTSELIKEYGRDIKRYDGDDYKEMTSELPAGALLFGRYKFGPEQATKLTNYLTIRSAQDVTNMEPVVVKFFSSETMFNKDVAVAEHLRSPHVVSVSEKFILPTDMVGSRFIAITEFSPASLDRVLHGLEEIDALFTKLSINSLIDCIHWLHHKNIAHLNIRPACFYHEWGDVTTWKIGHFVSSRVTENDHVDWEVITLSRYSAPELSMHWGELFMPVQKSMDMWSLGCVIFELATARSLFTDLDNLNRCISTPGWSVPLDDISSPEIRRILEGLLCIDPKYRMDVNTARDIMVIKDEKEEILSGSSKPAKPLAVEDVANVTGVVDTDDFADVVDVADTKDAVDVVDVFNVPAEEHENRPSISAEDRSSFAIEEVDGVKQ